jgi:hypothetical protein
VTEADTTGDLTPEEQAAAAVLAALDAARDRLHRRSAAALLTVLGLFANGVNLASLRLAVDPEAERDARLAQVVAELQRQAILADVVNAWNAVNQAAHTDAVHYAASAVGHLLTDGELPADPADYPKTAPALPRPPDNGELPQPEPDPIGTERPTSYVSDGWIDDQVGGLASDVEAAIMADISDAALFDLIGDGPGALYYLDLLTSRDFITTTASMLADLGVLTVDWTTMGDSRVCRLCASNADRSPYDLADVPDVPHGLCRCWIMPTK